MSTMSIGKQILIDGAAAACSFGPQAFIPALAGSYITRKLASTINMDGLRNPAFSTLEKVASVALSALSLVSAVYLGLSMASILGYNFSVNQAAAVYVVSEAFTKIMEYLNPPRPSVLLP